MSVGSPKLWILWALLLGLVPSAAVAKKPVHEIKRGDSLNRIGKKYGCKVSALRRANRLKGPLRAGKVLKLPRSCTKVKHPPRIHKVKRGQTLARIARKYKCKIKQLKKANGLKSNTLSIGARLRVPDCSKPVRAGRALAAAKKKKKKKKRTLKRFHMAFSHVNTKEKVKDLWVIRHAKRNKNRQWVGKKARTKIEHLLRDWKHKKRKTVPERLIWQLYLVAQHFDAEVQIVSGYRSKERKGSRHAHGKAVDFRVKGVDPKAVWTYCKRFKKTGLGWYPTSKFTHMDVRKKGYFWIDDSGPGQKARYRKGVSQRRPKSARAKQRLVKAPHKKARRASKRRRGKRSGRTTGKSTGSGKKAGGKTARKATRKVKAGERRKAKAAKVGKRRKATKARKLADNKGS